jgi:RNA polymerase sigma-70 factor (ECF subfamily)
MDGRELDQKFEIAETSQAVDLDRELTLSFQRGDKWAFDSIYRRYSSRVEALCQRMLRDPQEAQDAAQEVFIRVYRGLPRFNGQYRLGPWIKRIATNVCLDQLRSQNRRLCDSAPSDVLEDRVGAHPDEVPEEALLRRVDGVRVHETLASLAPLHRRALTMRGLEGRDYRDIATSLGVSRSRARLLLHRARKGFKRSWVSAGVLLGLPSRLLQRVRELRDPAFTHPMVEAASSGAQATHTLAAGPPLAASCSQTFHGCGQVLSERIAAAATAAVLSVGVTGAGGAAPGLRSGATDVVRVPGSVREVQAENLGAAAAKGATTIAHTMTQVATASDAPDGVEDVAAGRARVGLEGRGWEPADSNHPRAPVSSSPDGSSQEESAPTDSASSGMSTETTGARNEVSNDPGVCPVSGSDASATGDDQADPAAQASSTPTPEPSASADSTSVTPEVAETPAEESEPPAEESETPAEESESPGDVSGTWGDLSETPGTASQTPAEVSQAPGEESEAPADGGSASGDAGIDETVADDAGGSGIDDRLAPDEPPADCDNLDASQMPTPERSTAAVRESTASEGATF